MHKQAAVFKSPTKVMDNVKKGAKKKNRADVCGDSSLYQSMADGVG